MQIPSDALIETASDMLKSGKVDDATLLKQLHELHEAMGDSSDSFQAGYQLGLQTARVMVMLMPKAIQAGVEI